MRRGSIIIDKTFDDFQIGDVYVLKRSFSEADFSAFSKISGDTNPLHHNENYAKNTEFNKIIVPMHLIAAPLSSVAGMVFPGHRSLYLSHEVKSHLPVFFDEEVTYASKIIEKNRPENILIIRTIVYRDAKVLMSAIQKVQIRNEDIDVKILKETKVAGQLLSNEKSYTLVTGAAGEIAQSTIMRLAKNGTNLILIVRRIDKNFAELVSRVKEYGSDVEIIEMDLSSEKMKPLFAEFLKKFRGFIETVIFAASPNIGACINEQMSVNYSSLKYITEFCLPQWLERQYGQILYLSSSAMHYHPLGFDDYVTAKAAGTNYLDGIRKRFLQWGIKVQCLAVGKVDTNFSSSLNSQIKMQMIPEQVAETIVDILYDKGSSDFYYWLEKSGLKIGSYEFISKAVSSVKSTAIKPEFSGNTDSFNMADKLKSFMLDFFNLEQGVSWENVGIDLIPGWDSLRHIEFILAIEKSFSVKLSTQEIDKTMTFHDLLDLLEGK
ncbi:SDR family NAD(P)-dependent oxidoreductase [bacterium]|nr:SDR family NAD(P)-dependent oxidoreductase [bacterium]